MGKKKSNSALTLLLIGILLIFVGGGALGLTLILGSENEDLKQLCDILMYVCIAIAAFGVICLLAGIISGKSGSKSSGKKQSETDALPSEAANGQAVEPTYVFEPQSYEFVTVGRRQSVEDKFNEIAKMGKTQFVIYMCKLFSLKGYEVTYTPVAGNNNIDLIVKRDGVTRAVGCLLANKVMCEEDVTPVYEGASFYNVDGVAVVTNMYFDRTALNFAKAHKITLIDRNILIEQYMN